MKKKGSKKISKVKRSNQVNSRLSKQGKLKKRRNKKVVEKAIHRQPSTNADISDDEEDLPSVSNRDLNFLRKAVNQKAYKFLGNLDLSSTDPSAKGKRKRKAPENEDEELENKYELSNFETDAKKQKVLLPIKTAKGLVARAIDIDSDDEKKYPPSSQKQVPAADHSFHVFAARSEVSSAELLAVRQKTLEKKKFRIGLLAAGLLEAPEAKVGNFKILLEMLEERDPLIKMTVRKLALVSLLEVFKDLLPSYQIRHSDKPGVKLKKDVKALHEYENGLLRAYKIFLQKLEKIISILRRKKGDSRVFKEAELKLAEIGLQSVCDLLISHPYFNFSKNIIHLIVPYLNTAKESSRSIVGSCIKTMLRTDSRGEVTLEIVRSINKLVKAKNFAVHPTTLEILLNLKLKEVNLDSEKEAELKKKKLSSKKGNLLRLSKRERKREKRLKELNQELLETKADESKKSKLQNLTEVTKLVFAMYFKVLKLAPSARLLNAALQGVAKFAHCINVDYYHDLINVLNYLIENETLGPKEQLCCVQTVFTILSYQGATINIDPIRFYTHFYNNLLSVTAGKNHDDLRIILNAADSIVLKRRKHLSLQRLLAFTKRLTALTVQVLPNGVLGLLSLVRQVLQLSKASGVLLDTDASFGQGVYQPELEEPEYCNAGATALWELLPLQRHYHPTVREYAQYICSLGDGAKESTASGKPFVKKLPQEMFKEYDASEVKFVPAVTPPSSVSFKKHKGRAKIRNNALKDYMKKTINYKLN